MRPRRAYDDEARVVFKPNGAPRLAGETPPLSWHGPLARHLKVHTLLGLSCANSFQVRFLRNEFGQVRRGVPHKRRFSDGDHHVGTT
jgi:hypothetical protein